MNLQELELPVPGASLQPSGRRQGIGVVIPVRNRPVSVVNAIGSVLLQSIRPDNIVVVDDGSTDATVDEVQRLIGGVDNLRLVTIPHSGPAAARNTGLAILDEAQDAASGGQTADSDRLVAFLDSDDCWPPDFLHRAQQRLCERPDLGFVVSDRLEAFHRQGARLFSARCYDADPWEALRRQSPRIISCSVFRRRTLASAPFPEGSFIGEDAALLIALLAAGAASGWISGDPVVANAIPPGDEDRLTTHDRSGGEKVRARIASAEAYAAALSASPAAVAPQLGGRLLAARWLAALMHSLAARDRLAIARSFAELWRCGVRATALGALDHWHVLRRRDDGRP